MSTLLSFNLFGNVLHWKQTNHRRISVPKLSMMELFVRMEFISYWQNCSSLNDVGIVEMPGMLLSSVSKIKLDAWEKTKTQRNQAFHIVVLFFFSRCEKYNLLLLLLRNGCCLIDPFTFWRFYKVLHQSIAWFWKYSNKLWGCSNPASLSFRNTKSFQPSILIKKTASPTTKVEVN